MEHHASSHLDTKEKSTKYVLFLIIRTGGVQLLITTTRTKNGAIASFVQTVRELPKFILQDKNLGHLCMNDESVSIGGGGLRFSSRLLGEGLLEQI